MGFVSRNARTSKPCYEDHTLHTLKRCLLSPTVAVTSSPTGIHSCPSGSVGSVRNEFSLGDLDRRVGWDTTCWSMNYLKSRVPEYVYVLYVGGVWQQWNRKGHSSMKYHES